MEEEQEGGPAPGREEATAGEGRVRGEGEAEGRGVVEAEGVELVTS